MGCPSRSPFTGPADNLPSPCLRQDFACFLHGTRSRDCSHVSDLTLAVTFADVNPAITKVCMSFGALNACTKRRGGSGKTRGEGGRARGREGGREGTFCCQDSAKSTVLILGVPIFPDFPFFLPKLISYLFPFFTLSLLPVCSARSSSWDLSAGRFKQRRTRSR